MSTSCSLKSALSSPLSRWFIQFVHRWLLMSIVASTLWLIGGMNCPVRAETRDLVIERFIADPTAVGNLISATEAQIQTMIVSQFAENPSVSAVRVVVLGRRNNEILPILTTIVSRSQWQSNPQVAVWTRYSSASAILLARTAEDTGTVGRLEADRGSTIRQPNNNDANTRRQSAPISTSSTPSLSTSPNRGPSPDRSVQIDEAFSEGRLTPSEYQQLVDAFD